MDLMATIMITVVSAICQGTSNHWCGLKEMYVFVEKQVDVV